MEFEAPLVHGRLIRRYKRFLADIEMDSGEQVTAHCTNSGSMKSCIEEGAEVYLSPAKNTERKTLFTWEMIKINGNWVGVNTLRPNQIAFEAVKQNEIDQLKGYSLIKREVTYKNSRFDLYCENKTESCYVEVKNVTLKENEWALFPDAVSVRAQKHLQTLIEVKSNGIRAVMLYIVQRTDVSFFTPAKSIDPVYAKLLSEAVGKGVEVIVMQAGVSPKGIKLIKQMPVILQ